MDDGRQTSQEVTNRSIIPRSAVRCLDRHSGGRLAKRSDSSRFVGRGGEKLEGALEAFQVDVSQKVAADLGAHIGGFTDCLLQRGAARVYSADTAYGVLDWKLRQDPRVVVIERRNALHLELPEPVDLVVIDLGWTPLNLIVPRALHMVGRCGKVVSLLKPQYEAGESEREGGVVRPEFLEKVVNRVIHQLERSSCKVLDRSESKLPGAGGNREFFLSIGRGAQQVG